MVVVVGLAGELGVVVVVEGWVAVRVVGAVLVVMLVVVVMVVEVLVLWCW